MKVELNKFKKQISGPCFVSWNRKIVTANDKSYQLTFINCGGKRYPYVEIPDAPKSTVESRYKDGIKSFINFGVDKNNKIRTIINNKFELKMCSYEYENIDYHVIGIGPEAILAFKGNNENAEYFRYETKTGNDLLNILFHTIEQKTLDDF